MDSNDIEDASEAATDLMFWLDRGGAAPNMTPEDHRRLWLAVSALAIKAGAWERAEL